MKRIIAPVIVLIIVSLIITACNVTIMNDPEINIQFSVADLTDKEYDSIGTYGLENPTKDDFKIIDFKLDVKHSNKITNRKIIMPDLTVAANSYDKVRYWSGESYSQDNQQDNFAQYGYKFVLLTRGLDEQGIKNIFKSVEVKVSWSTKDDHYEEKVFKLIDLLNLNK